MKCGNVHKKWSCIDTKFCQIRSIEILFGPARIRMLQINKETENEMRSWDIECLDFS